MYRLRLYIRRNCCNNLKVYYISLKNEYRTSYFKKAFSLLLFLMPAFFFIDAQEAFISGIENSVLPEIYKDENKMYYEHSFISFEIAKKKALIFELFDLYGRIMLSEQIRSGERILIDFANGIYFACLRDGNAYAKKWKFMHAN